MIFSGNGCVAVKYHEGGGAKLAVDRCIGFILCAPGWLLLVGQLDFHEDEEEEGQEKDWKRGTSLSNLSQPR